MKDEEVLDESMSAKEADDFVKRLKSESEIRFKYKKVDGSTRKARGTLKPEAIRKGLTAEKIDKAKRHHKIPDTVIVYWDLDKEMFRCFKKDNFISAEKAKKRSSEDEK